MDHRWHSDPIHTARVRLAARVLPPVIALVGAGHALVVIFPESTQTAMTAIGLSLAGLGGAMLARRLAPPVQQIRAADPAARLYDEESHLGNRLYLRETLAREIARNSRAGTHCTLCVFETRLVGSDSRKPPAHIPEVANFIGRTLKSEARGADYVARLGYARWAAVLADTDRDGARVFATRVMEALAAKPCARGDDGAGVYVRAMATAVEWRTDITTADGFIEEAVVRMEAAAASRPASGELRPARSA